MSGIAETSPGRDRETRRKLTTLRALLTPKGALPPRLAVVVAIGITATVTWVVVVVSNAVGPT
jgi:hypothetical protein